MAETERWCGAGSTGDSCSRMARRRRMMLRRTRLAHLRLLPPSNHHCTALSLACGTQSKRRRLDVSSCETASASFTKGTCTSDATLSSCPRYGVTSIRGRRREMEDTVSVHPAFAGARHHSHHDQQQSDISYHFFGVFDGHGCSHVAELCKQRMHEIVAEELNNSEAYSAGPDHMTKGRTHWLKAAMEKCFAQMDKEAIALSSGSKSKPPPTLSCSCELRLPRSNNLGSTATVAVVGPRHVVVANCGDSRAVLCRNGSAIPLSSDHKPDRPDELQRIQSAGGRVIYWDGARVFGVLAMSRAIGDSYLKPFVISEPEVTITEITEQDECLILASDGLWDVVPNELACQVVSRCLRAAHSSSSRCISTGVDNGVCMTPSQSGNEDGKETVGGLDKACVDAAMLLTKLALARHTTDNISVVVINLRPHRFD